MSFVRDLLAPSTRNNVPLARVTDPRNQDYHPLDTADPGPSTTPVNARPSPRRTSSLPPAPASLYDEDEEELFNSRAPPRRSLDRSRLYPPGARDPTSSNCSTASATPVPSRVPSPVPFYYSGTSSCSSDSESEPESPFLGTHTRRRPPWRDDERPRWWPFGLASDPNIGTRRRRRRWRDVSWGAARSLKRIVRRLVRHPFFPKTPITILLTLLFLTIFGVSLTFLLIYILNPDKEPLPWRGYCTLPPHSGGPPSLSLSTTSFLQTPIPTNFSIPTFPPVDLDSLAPAGVFVGVFSMDASVERRMLVRSTWASHVRSREGAGDGDGGAGTSRTVVRFILGQPRKDWERRIQLEMEMYQDIVILPTRENMNSGKTHAYFSWAANHSWVPPIYFDDFKTGPANFTYLNASSPAPALAHHDPIYAHRDRFTNSPPRPWVRPDYVVKADDDAFVMLAELEARLRVDLYKEPLPPPPSVSRKQQLSQQSQLRARDNGAAPTILERDGIPPLFDFTLPSYITQPPPILTAAPPKVPSLSPDPLVFWGYLVKNRFMAGELYALSYALVEWVANDPVVKTMTNGAEDKQTSKWIRAHPRAEQVRWSSERCWIYDHPRGGTVYSHGFLFPSEVKRVQDGVRRDLEQLAQEWAAPVVSTPSSNVPAGRDILAPEKWAHSTVSKWHAHYAPPVVDLSLDYSVEALVEGSDMSMVHEDGSMTSDLAWKYREGRRVRYDGQRVGGTVVVHFIKKHMWFLETAAAFLHGDDVTPLERAFEDSNEEEKDADMGTGEDENGTNEAGDFSSSSAGSGVTPGPTGMDSDLTSSSTRTMKPRTNRRVRRGRGIVH